MLQLGEVSLESVEKDHLSFLVKSGNSGGLLEQKLTKKKTSVLHQQRQVQDISVKSNHFIFVVTVRGQCVGLCELVDVDWLNKTCVIHMYFEDRAEVAPVYGTKALSLALSYVYYTLGLQKVVANVAIDDVVMSTLYKQQGFKAEVRKRAHYFGNGTYKTIVEMGLLASEFEGLI